MSALNQYIASRGLQNAPAGNPMGNVAQISPELIAMLPNLLKGVAANTAGVLGDFASMPLAAYTSGFSMGNGQYPGKVMSNVPGATDWLGEKMGADVNSPAFIAGGFMTPDPTDLAKLTAVGKMAANYPALNAMLAGMTAWHGGPHKFDKFDASKIGTGEGAQAYGYGLYFAENPEVAGTYKRVLGDHEFDIGGRKLYTGASTKALDQQTKGELIAAEELAAAIDAQSSSPAQFAANALRKKAKMYPEDTKDIDDAMNVIADWQQSGSVHQNSGHLYEVDIPDEAIAKMLDWDGILDEQPQEVKDLAKLWGIKSKNSGDVFGRDILKEAERRMGGARGASDGLNQMGIPGIRYLDGSSRSAGEGTRNFVVFDDTIPKVVSRNGEKVDDVVQIPIGRGKSTQPVQRYWYHNVRGRGFQDDGSIAPYRHKDNSDLLSMYSKDAQPEGLVYLSPTPFGAESVRVDVSKLDPSLMRKTGQAEGYAVYAGSIPKSSYESPPTKVVSRNGEKLNK